ncbi:hypothetical protein B566_EDAN010543 [Ephemera danica]|nr:hypothetical protein B566_EDAN010543 [Ephemera danica]
MHLERKTIAEITLRSIYSQEYLRKMKFSHTQHQARADDYYDRYMTFRHNSDAVLLNMAENLELAPTLLARLVLEKHYEKRAEYDEESKISRGFVTKLMKDTSLIDDKGLANEVYLQYEYKLARLLKEKKIPFQDEEQMRLMGFDKTPDIKLDLPIAVNGSVVHWIESKALFGSEEWHDNFVKKQLSTYWNSIHNLHGKNLLVSNYLPDSISQMDTTLLGTATNE